MPLIFIVPFKWFCGMIDEISIELKRTNSCSISFGCTLYQHNIIEFVPYMCYLHASLTVSISIMIWRYEKFLTPKFMLYPRVYSYRSVSFSLPLHLSPSLSISLSLSLSFCPLVHKSLNVWAESILFVWLIAMHTICVCFYMLFQLGYSKRTAHKLHTVRRCNACEI